MAYKRYNKKELWLLFYLSGVAFFETSSTFSSMANGDH